MKILFFITGLGMGGAEKVVCELADKLYEMGHKVNIVYFTGDLVRKPKSQNINIYRIPMGLNILIFKRIFELVRLIDKLKPDVIHAHMFHANIIARFLKIFRKKIRVICSSHSSYEGGYIRMKIYALTEKLCDVHTNVSYNASEALVKSGAVKERKILTVYNGIDINKYRLNENLRNRTRKELGFNKDSKIILAIGRIGTPKDYPTLLKSFKVVREKQKNIYLLIAGDGPKRQEIESLSKCLGIDNYVTFLGIRNDIPELLNACDLFVSSSAWEGFGIAILEAMICKKPIVSTKTDGAIELLPLDCLVNIGDSQEIAKKILIKINSTEKLFTYNKVECFDWNLIVNDWLNIYSNEV